MPFNSATAVTPWVTHDSRKFCRAFALLQFGHGGDAVGDACQLVSAAVAARTFNSATAVTPWVTTLPLFCGPTRLSALQFGHGGDAVGDASTAARQRDGGFTFNSATAVTPWVTFAAGHLAKLSPTPSIRPRR